MIARQPGSHGQGWLSAQVPVVAVTADSSGGVHFLLLQPSMLPGLPAVAPVGLTHSS